MTLSAEDLECMGNLFDLKSYHNTTEESGETLVDCETKARAPMKDWQASARGWISRNKEREEDNKGYVPQVED